MSGQDKLWLQNSKAFSRILRSIQAQKPSMLFFKATLIKVSPNGKFCDASTLFS